MKLAALVSGGKDSWYAAYMARKFGNEIACIVTLKPEKSDSYMFHFPNVEFVSKQAEAADLPIIELPTKGVKEQELQDLKEAINLAKQKHHIEGVCSGALASEYQKTRVDAICEELSLKSVAPIWHMDPMMYMQGLLLNNFKVIIVGIAAEGLSEEWLGKEIERNSLQELRRLAEKHRFHLAFEGGEAETFVLDCPLFKKRLEVWDSETVMENDYTGKLVIRELQIVKK